MRRSLLIPLIFTLFAAGCGPADGHLGETSEALNGYGWNTAWTQLGGYATSDPALVTTVDGKVHAFVRGGEGNLWENVRSGTSWSGWHTLGGYMLGSPSVVTDGYRIAAFVRGGDNAAYLRFFDGNQWATTWSYNGTLDPWLNLGGSLTSDPLATITTGSPPRIDVFTTDPNHTLFVTSSSSMNYAWLGSQWSDWGGLNLQVQVDPSATAAPMFAAGSGASCVEVVASGSQMVGQTQYFTPQSARWCGPGTTWGSWALVGSQLQIGGASELMQPWARPAVFKWGDGYTGVIAMAQDAHFYYSFKSGTSWSVWQALGGTGIREGRANSTPVFGSWATGDLEVFTQGTDLGLFHQTGTAVGNNWPSWTGWYEQVTPECYWRGGRPAIATPRANHVDLVLVGADRQLYANTYDAQPSTAPGPRPPACQCGLQGHEACGNFACNPGLVADANLLCDPCGGLGGRCCSGSTPCGSGMACESRGGGQPSICLACGGLGEQCCGNTQCNGSASQALHCMIEPYQFGQQFTCDVCGGAGQLCCNGTTCAAGNTCNFSNYTCQGTSSPPPSTTCGETDGSACCATGLRCQNQMECLSDGACHYCGGLGARCCLNGGCGSGSACYPGDGLCHGCGFSGGQCCNTSSGPWCAGGGCYEDLNIGVDLCP